MKLFKKKSEGSTRVILTITVLALILWSCFALEAQVNRELFIQFEPNSYTMNLKHCFELFFVYSVCFVPMIVYWIINGFREDENNKYM